MNLEFFSVDEGDEVLSVNGTSFEGFTHRQALDTFKVEADYFVT